MYACKKEKSTDKPNVTSYTIYKDCVNMFFKKKFISDKMNKYVIFL